MIYLVIILWIVVWVVQGYLAFKTIKKKKASLLDIQILFGTLIMELILLAILKYL